MPQIAEKTEPDVPPNCAVLPYMYFANAERNSSSRGNIECLRPLWNLHQPSAVHLRRRMRSVKTASSQLSPLAGFCASGIFSFSVVQPFTFYILLIPYSIELSSPHRRIIAYNLQQIIFELSQVCSVCRKVEGEIPRPRWFFTSECGMSYDSRGICHALISVCSRWWERSDRGLPRYSAYSACTSGFSWEKRSAEL